MESSNTELNRIIRQIFDKYGVGILLNSDRFCGLIEDLAPSMHLERRVMRRLNQEKLFTVIYQELVALRKSGEGSTKIKTLLDDSGFSEGWKRIVLSAFGFSEDGDVSVYTDTMCSQLKEPITSARLDNCIDEPGIREILETAFEKVTTSGPIIIEESYTTYTYLEIVDGMKIDRGFISPYMVKDQEKVETILEEPYILITNAALTKSSDIQKIANIIMPTKKGILIIATDIQGAALAEIIKDSFPCIAVKAPSYGDRRIDILKDIAIITGGEAIITSDQVGINDISLEKLGQAEKVVVRSEETIIISGTHNKKALQERQHHIRELIKQSFSDFDREKLQERFANLERGVAIIKVGGKTVSEAKKQLQMIESTLAASRSSV